MSNLPLLKQLAQRTLPSPIFAAGVAWWQRRLIRTYLRAGMVPWSEGYEVYKRQLIAQTWADRALMDRFRSATLLPPGYGVAVEERCVEYPWLLANLRDGPEIVLDAGSVLNYGYILEHPKLQSKSIHILTLAPEAHCFWQRGISYLFHDLRDIPIRDAFYDTVVCGSTLEHVGFDNRLFTHNDAHREDRPADFELVVREFARVLKPGGVFLLTVPFGVYQHAGTFQQFDRKLLSRAIAAFGPTDEVRDVFYRYTAQGWNVAGADDCADCEYVEWGMLPLEIRPRSFPVQPDKAAAARAVACVRLVKSTVPNR